MLLRFYPWSASRTCIPSWKIHGQPYFSDILGISNPVLFINYRGIPVSLVQSVPSQCWRNPGPRLFVRCLLPYRYRSLWLRQLPWERPRGYGRWFVRVFPPSLVSCCPTGSHLPVHGFLSRIQINRNGTSSFYSTPRSTERCLPWLRGIGLVFSLD